VRRHDEGPELERQQPGRAPERSLGEDHQRFAGAGMRFENPRVFDAACRIGPLDEHRTEPAQRRAEQRRAGQLTLGRITEARRQDSGEQDRIDITRVVGNDKHRTRVR